MHFHEGEQLNLYKIKDITIVTKAQQYLIDGQENRNIYQQWFWYSRVNHIIQDFLKSLI